MESSSLFEDDHNRLEWQEHPFEHHVPVPALSLEALAQRTRELEALYRADELLYQHLHVDRVLQSIVDVITDIFHVDKTSVMVWDELQGRLVARASHGFSGQALQRMADYRPGEGIAGKVFQSGEPLAIEDVSQAAPPANQIAAAEGIRSVLSLPIRIGDEIYGVFGLNYLQPRRFNQDDRRFFTALAQRAAMAIRNARQFEQAEETAAREERQRLSRELHDSVIQMLYSLTLFAEAGRLQSSLGDMDLVKSHLTQIAETGQQALKEMRLLVYQLRPIELAQGGLAQALRQRLDAVERRAGLQVVFNAEELPPMDTSQEDALFRIAQEALNNSLKHSGAARVSVQLRSEDGQVSLVVADDGRGFEVAPAAQSGGLGLTSMRERTEKLGGRLTIQSAPEHGARLTVQVPVQAQTTRRNGHG